MLTLQSSNGIEFELDQELAKTSVTIKNLIEDAGIDNAIPLPGVTSNTLENVIEYLTTLMPVDEPKQKPEEEDKDKKVMDHYAKMDQTTLFEMILAANYLEIKVLLDVLCKTVANTIKGKNPEEIRKTFNVENDFTPEEEEQVRKENEWCEER